MASKQARKQSSSASTSASRRPGQSSPPSGSARSSSMPASGESDPNFNLISVLYHALQGADTAARYQQDAERAGQEELGMFFEQTRAEYTARAQKAKAILASMLSSNESEQDDLSDQDDEEDIEDDD